MTLDDFTDLLDRCGGDPGLWPSGAQVGAQRLLSASAPARTLLARAQALDALLAGTRARASREALQDMADMATTRLQASRPIGGPWSFGAGWAAAAAVVLSLGFVAGAADRGAQAPFQAVASALGAAGEVDDAG